MRLGANIRLREDGRYEARYYKGRSKTGRARYGSVYGRTPEEADKNRTELLKSLPETGYHIRVCVEKKDAIVREKKYEPLDEIVAERIENIFSLNTCGSMFGFSLCLHFGISLGELCALRYSDFDFDSHLLCINKRMSVRTLNRGAIFETMERRIPIPQSIIRTYNRATRNSDCYVLTDTQVPIESASIAVHLFKREMSVYPELRSVIPGELQMTFIRRAIESGIGCQTISAITGISSTIINRRFGKYARPDMSVISFLSEKYFGLQSSSCEMNLLILGAGSHGRAVYEIAVKLGVFQNIKFLDDNVTGYNIIGKTEDIKSLKGEFNCCFVAIGDNETRRRLGELAISLHYIIPRIISPEASIANNDVQIGIGTVAFPQSTVNLGSRIGKFNIIASNSMLGFEVKTGDYVRCDSGSILTKKSNVPDMTTVEAGEIVRA